MPIKSMEIIQKQKKQKKSTESKLVNYEALSI